MISLDSGLIVGTIVAMGGLQVAVLIAYGMSIKDHVFGVKEEVLKQTSLNTELLETNKKVLKFWTNDFVHYVDKYMNK